MQHEIEIGSFDTVLINKMFGPTVYCNLKITADGCNAKWIVERERITKDAEIEWEKVCEIDAQESIFNGEEE